MLTWTCPQVNGKLYPMAKVQLGKMGALHPANRLAAYLTGRVASGRKPPSSPEAPAPPQVQSSASDPDAGGPPAVPEPPGAAPGGCTASRPRSRLWALGDLWVCSSSRGAGGSSGSAPCPAQ